MIADRQYDGEGWPRTSRRDVATVWRAGFPLGERDPRDKPREGETADDAGGDNAKPGEKYGERADGDNGGEHQ